MAEGEKLLPCPAPKADIRLFETQAALFPDAAEVYRYSTARGYVYEKHVDGKGVEAWFRVVKSG